LFCSFCSIFSYSGLAAFDADNIAKIAATIVPNFINGVSIVMAVVSIRQTFNQRLATSQQISNKGLSGSSWLFYKASTVFPAMNNLD